MPVAPKGAMAWARAETVKRGLLQQDGSGGRANAHAPLTKIKEMDQKKARTLVVRIGDPAQR